MFDSAIFDVAIGLVFTFMGVSLAASAVTEAIGSALKLRQSTLRQGIQALLNDEQFTGLARDLYNHAIVNPLASGTARTVSELTQQPAYVETKHFVVALMDILQAKGGGKPLAETIDSIPDEQLRTAFKTFLQRAEGDAARFEAAIGDWFDTAMNRLSGWYKRYTQVFAFGAALVICGFLNADAFHLTETIWRRPALISELGIASASIPPPTEAIAGLQKSTLIGWADWSIDDPRNTIPGKIGMILGWLTVAAASLFGAPFWFDTLQRIVQIRGTGNTAKETSGQPSDGR